MSGSDPTEETPAFAGMTWWTVLAALLVGMIWWASVSRWSGAAEPWDVPQY